MMNGTPLIIRLYVCVCVTRMLRSGVYITCLGMYLYNFRSLYNKAIPCSFHAGGSLVVAEELDQSNASHAISHKRTMSQETLAGVYKRPNSLLGHPLIQVTWRCSNYCEKLSFQLASTFALFAQVLVWVVMSLLPLVAGGRSRFQAESEAAVGFAGAGVEEPPLEAFPNIEEELEEGSDSPWHGLFGESDVWE